MRSAADVAACQTALPWRDRRIKTWPRHRGSIGNQYGGQFRLPIHTDVPVATVIDPVQAFPASTGFVQRIQTQSGRHIAPFIEPADIVNGGDEIRNRSLPCARHIQTAYFAALTPKYGRAFDAIGQGMLVLAQDAADHVSDQDAGG